MRLTVVGSSGSVSGPESVASCYLLEADDGSRTWRVLLDLGPGSVGQAMRYVNPATVDAVLLSHLHADHVADIAGLEVLLRYGPGAPHQLMPVYGPGGTAARIAQICGNHEGEDFGCEEAFQIGTWAEGETVRIGPLAVEPFVVEHPVPAYAMRITGPAEDEARGREGTAAGPAGLPPRTKVLTYTGDTDLCEGLDDAAAGADLLLSEAAFQEGRDEVRGIHLTGRRAGQVATTAGVARLVLTHIPPWTCAKTVHAEAAQAYDGAIDVAVPGGVWRL